MGYILVILLYLKVYARSKDKLDFPLTKSMTFAGDLRRAKEQGEERGEAEDGRRGGAGRVPGGQRQGRAIRAVPWVLSGLGPVVPPPKRPQLMEKHRKNMGFTG